MGSWRPEILGAAAAAALQETLQPLPLPGFMGLGAVRRLGMSRQSLNGPRVQRVASRAGGGSACQRGNLQQVRR